MERDMWRKIGAYQNKRSSPSTPKLRHRLDSRGKPSVRSHVARKLKRNG